MPRDQIALNSALSFRDIIETWPSVYALANDIGAGAEIVRQWHVRNSIAPGWFYSVVAAAQAKGYRWITYEVMCLAAHNTRIKRVLG
jgi:hypothetical protein